MGKLNITGKAERKVPCTTTKMTIRFQSHSQTTAEALSQTMKQCEEFLKFLSDNNIQFDTRMIGEDSVEQEYDESELDSCATREIVIEYPFNMELDNYLRQIIIDKEYDVDIDVSYSISNLKEIHNELLKEALEDSKAKATFIAEAMGEKIVGIDEMKFREHYGSNDYMWQEQERGIHRLAESHSFSHSNKLKAKETTETETIDVTWLIE